MPTTTVTKHHHACVFVDDETTRILVDPGRLGPPPALDGVGAVLITHAHFEHFDPDLVHDALHQGIDVWAPEDVIAELDLTLGLAGHMSVDELTPEALATVE